MTRRRLPSPATSREPTQSFVASSSTSGLPTTRWKSLRHDGHLKIDLSPDIAAEDWERLIRETRFDIATAKRVTIVIPPGFEHGHHGASLTDLTESIEFRGVDVVRRYL